MKDGYGHKLSEEEVAKITGKPVQTDAEGQSAKPHVQPSKDDLANADPDMLSGGGNSTSGNGDGRALEIIDEP